MFDYSYTIYIKVIQVIISKAWHNNLFDQCVRPHSAGPPKTGRKQAQTAANADYQ